MIMEIKNNDDLRKMREPFIRKITGFRFIVFMFTGGMVFYYVHLCRANNDLIQLQGLILGIIGIAITLIGGKTATDVYGKKPQ